MCVPNLTAHSGRPVSIKQFLVVAPVIGNKSDDCRRQLGENRRRRRLEFYQTESWRIGGVQSGNQPGQPYIQQSSKDSNKQCERGRRTRHHVPCFGWVLLNERGKKEKKKKLFSFLSFSLLRGAFYWLLARFPSCRWLCVASYPTASLQSAGLHGRQNLLPSSSSIFFFFFLMYMYRYIYRTVSLIPLAAWAAKSSLFFPSLKTYVGTAYL